MKHRQTKAEIKKEHIFYLKKIGVTVAVSASIVLYGYINFTSYGDEEYLKKTIIISLLILVAGLIMVLRNYIPVIRYLSEDDYLVVEENKILLSNIKLGNDKTFFPLDKVKTFNHYLKPNESIELITESGEELVLEGYEEMDVLLEELKSSNAGSKYKRI